MTKLFINTLPQSCATTLNVRSRIKERDGHRPIARVHFGGDPIDALSHFLGEVQKKSELIKQERERIRPMGGW